MTNMVLQVNKFVFVRPQMLNKEQIIVILQLFDGFVFVEQINSTVWNNFVEQKSLKIKFVLFVQNVEQIGFLFNKLTACI